MRTLKIILAGALLIIAFSASSTASAATVQVSDNSGNNSAAGTSMAAIFVATASLMAMSGGDLTFLSRNKTACCDSTPRMSKPQTV